MENEIKMQNAKLLDDAYKNVRMGSYAIDCILEKIEDKDFRNLMDKQNDFYLDYTNKINTLSKDLLYTPEDISAMLKTSSFLNINLKTMMNKDTSHIAEMLVEGTTMGITTLIKEIKQNPNADKNVIELSNQIVANQEKFVESLKDFL